MQNRALRFLFAAGLFGLMITSVPTAFCKDKQLAPKDAEPATAGRMRKFGRNCPSRIRMISTDAARGFIATFPEVVIYGDDGQVAWSLKEYEFLSAEKVPPTVNPSLWRQAVLNMNNGLFKVTEGDGSTRSAASTWRA